MSLDNILSINHDNKPLVKPYLANVNVYSSIVFAGSQL
ncbi:hypothetical protein SynPROSU1_00102 [Synechococcus sp. PROS-U-1]|nr:hypothetical protein SynPROSU1_00102 [Synechococcus sp. PROS-U-1]